MTLFKLESRKGEVFFSQQVDSIPESITSTGEDQYIVMDGIKYWVNEVIKSIEYEDKHLALTQLKFIVTYMGDMI